MNECSDTNLSNLLKTDKRLRNGETVFLGFVGFTSPDFAEKAMEEKEILVLKKPVKLTYARGSRQRGSQYFSKTRLHISGIGSLHEQELVGMLGNNCDLIWPKDAKNAKKPYVFAQFQTEDEKKEAIDKLNGKKVDEENTLKLSPAYSQRFTQRPPIDRRRRFQG